MINSLKEDQRKYIRQNLINQKFRINSQIQKYSKTELSIMKLPILKPFNPFQYVTHIFWWEKKPLILIFRKFITSKFLQTGIDWLGFHATRRERWMVIINGTCCGWRIKQCLQATVPPGRKIGMCRSNEADICLWPCACNTDNRSYICRDQSTRQQ